LRGNRAELFTRDDLVMAAFTKISRAPSNDRHGASFDVHDAIRRPGTGIRPSSSTHASKEFQ
jgi:hypothetical protein